jgi:hypothetical protein
MVILPKPDPLLMQDSANQMNPSNPPGDELRRLKSSVKAVYFAFVRSFGLDIADLGRGFLRFAEKRFYRRAGVERIKVDTGMLTEKRFGVFRNFSRNDSRRNPDLLVPVAFEYPRHDPSPSGHQEFPRAALWPPRACWRSCRGSCVVTRSPWLHLLTHRTGSA